MKRTKPQATLGVEMVHFGQLCYVLTSLLEYYSQWFGASGALVNKERKENQDGGVGRHTAPPRTTRTDRELNSKGDQHEGNRK